LRRPSRERTLLNQLERDPCSAELDYSGAYRTIFPWMAQDTQYWSFRYILGTVYSGKTEASEISPDQRISLLLDHVDAHGRGTRGVRMRDRRQRVL
jgi:hypothetical protein